MRFKIVSWRSQRGAEMWLLDPLGALIMVTVAGGWLLFGSEEVPVVVFAVVAVVPSLWLLRLRIVRDQPTVVRGTILWCFIPIKRRSAPVGTMASAHSDDFASNDGDPHDEVSLGGWSFDCRRADRVVAWLRESSAALAAPVAKAEP